MSGRADILTLLLHAGADLSIKDKEGKTALDWAIQQHQEEAIAILQKQLSQPSNSEPARDK
jgi:ankyrin repeat protein